MPKTPSERRKRKTQAVPSPRWARIAEIKDAIRRGTYDTPDKWESLLDRLILDVRNLDSARRRKP